MKEGNLHKVSTLDKELYPFVFELGFQQGTMQSDIKESPEKWIKEKLPGIWS